jgi:hypothetical protein
LQLRITVVLSYVFFTVLSAAAAGDENLCLSCANHKSEEQLHAIETRSKPNAPANCMTILAGCMRSMGALDQAKVYSLTPEVVGCAADYGCRVQPSECKMVFDACKTAKGDSTEAFTCAVGLGCKVKKEQCDDVAAACLRKQGKAVCPKWDYVCKDGKPCAPGNEAMGTRNCAVKYKYESTKKSTMCIKSFHCP